MKNKNNKKNKQRKQKNNNEFGGVIKGCSQFIDCERKLVNKPVCLKKQLQLAPKSFMLILTGLKILSVFRINLIILQLPDVQVCKYCFYSNKSDLMFEEISSCGTLYHEIKQQTEP